MRTRIQKTRERLLAPALAMLVLGGLTVQRLSYAAPEDAEPYHQRVREAINRIPNRIGDWSGEEMNVSPGAMKLLRPNAICSRRYRFKKTMLSVELLVEHCRDARDMGIHYPPKCYPSQGWKLRQTRTALCQINPQTIIPVNEYEFSMGQPPDLRNIWVLNVLLLPDGTVSPDISVVGAAAADYRTHFFGAGQIQLVFDERIRPQERQRILKTFMSAIQPVFKAIGSGVKL